MQALEHVQIILEHYNIANNFRNFIRKTSTSDPFWSQKYFIYKFCSLLLTLYPLIFHASWKNLSIYANFQVLMKNSCTTNNVNSNEIQQQQQQQSVAFVWAWMFASKLAPGCRVQYSTSRSRAVFHLLKSALTFLIKYTLNTLDIKMHNCMQEILKIAKLLKKILSVLKTLVHISELLRAPIYRLKKISSLWIERT